LGDFHQNGIIATLHNLGARSSAELESDLLAFSKERPIGLLLPCLYSELEGPAMENIVAEIAKVPYISEIVIGLDRADREQWLKAREFFSVLPQKHRILWNDGPRLRALDDRLQEVGLAPSEPGKGRNVWYCSGYFLARDEVEAIALHDCDIVTYDRTLLDRLVYPVANPGFSYQFCKGYYARVAGSRMKGRVSRLLVSPLLKALVKTIGPNEYLDYLSAFRYPLAGEFSLRMEVLRDLRVPSDWGLEIGVLSEVHRNYGNSRLCQVDIADRYDHKHQSLSADNFDGGLAKMSTDICKAIFRKLATKGVVLSTETFRTIKACYYRKALDFLEAYHSDAVINGLALDRHEEQQAVEVFMHSLVRAGENFLSSPMETPFIPAWNRITSALPGFLEDMQEAVEADWQESASELEKRRGKPVAVAS